MAANYIRIRWRVAVIIIPGSRALNNSLAGALVPPLSGSSNSSSVLHQCHSTNDAHNIFSRSQRDFLIFYFPFPSPCPFVVTYIQVPLCNWVGSGAGIAIWATALTTQVHEVKVLEDRRLFLSLLTTLSPTCRRWPSKYPQASWKARVPDCPSGERAIPPKTQQARSIVIIPTVNRRLLYFVGLVNGSK